MIQDLDCRLNSIFNNKESVTYNEAIRLSESFSGKEDFKNAISYALKTSRIEYQIRVAIDLFTIIEDELYIDILNDLLLKELQEK